jgi:tagatose-1,6-bisphosphate aldolase
LILVRRQESDVAIEEASALITAMDQTGPDVRPCTLSVTLRVDGDWSEVGS